MNAFGRFILRQERRLAFIVLKYREKRVRAQTSKSSFETWHEDRRQNRLGCASFKKHDFVPRL